MNSATSKLQRFIIQVDFSSKAFKSFTHSTPRRFSVCRSVLELTPSKVYLSSTPRLKVRILLRNSMWPRPGSTVCNRVIIFCMGLVTLSTVSPGSLWGHRVVSKHAGYALRTNGSKVHFFPVDELVWQVWEAWCRQVVCCEDCLQMLS